MKKAAKYGKESSKDPKAEINWERLLLYMISTCGLDVPVHYQYIPKDDQETEFQEEIAGFKDYFLLNTSHSKSAKLLFYSAICRTLLLCFCYRVCKQKAVPRFVQPHLHHVIMTISFVFSSLTVWRLLWDSEPPNSISYFAYWFFLTIDVIFILIGYAFNHYIITNSVAVSEEDSPEEEDKSDKKKSKGEKENSEERKVPFLVMLKKGTNWYKAEWMSLIAGYVLIAVGTSGKYPIPICFYND